MAQPALSRSIARLERSVGVPLLERTSRTVSLTPAGAEFLADCRGVLQGRAPRWRVPEGYLSVAWSLRRALARPAACSADWCRTAQGCSSPTSCSLMTGRARCGTGVLMPRCCAGTGTTSQGCTPWKSPKRIPWCFCHGGMTWPGIPRCTAPSCAMTPTGWTSARRSGSMSWWTEWCWDSWSRWWAPQPRAAAGRSGGRVRHRPAGHRSGDGVARGVLQARARRARPDRTTAGKRGIGASPLSRLRRHSVPCRTAGAGTARVVFASPCGVGWPSLSSMREPAERARSPRCRRERLSSQRNARGLASRSRVIRVLNCFS